MRVGLHAIGNRAALRPSGREIFELLISSTLGEFSCGGVSPGNQFVRILRAADRPMMARPLVVRLDVEGYEKRVFGLLRLPFLIGFRVVTLRCNPASTVCGAATQLVVLIIRPSWPSYAANC